MEQEAAAEVVATATQNLRDNEDEEDTNGVIPPDVDLEDCNAFSDLGEDIEKELNHVGNLFTEKEGKEAFVEDVTESVAKMSLKKSGEKGSAAGHQGWSMDYTFPWFSYEYMENSHNYITIDWVVPPMPKAFFCPRVQHGGNALLLTTVIPSIFFDKDWLMLANLSGTISYSQNMNKATAFEHVVRKISEQHLEEDEAHDNYKANPQVMPLPYPVEQTITS